MRRVLHIIQSLDTGGAERVVAECALAHDRAKYSPEIACVFEGGQLVDALDGVLSRCRPDAEWVVEVDPSVTREQGIPEDKLVNVFRRAGYHAYELIER